MALLGHNKTHSEHPVEGVGVGVGVGGPGVGVGPGPGVVQASPVSIAVPLVICGVLGNKTQASKS